MAKAKPLDSAVKFVRGSFIDGVRGWIATAIVAPLTALAMFVWNTPIAGQSGADRFRDATRPLPAAAAEGDYVVLVASFAGDRDDAQSRRIAADLVEQFGAADAGSVVQVIAIPRLLRLSGDDVGAARAAAEAQGRRWLERQNGDLLLWGEVRPDTGELELRVLRAGDATRATYAIADLRAPMALSDQVGSAIAALIAADAAPAYASGRFTADVLAPLVERLRPLVGAAGGKLSGEARALVLLSFADASAQLGAQTGRQGPIEEAAAAYRRAIGGLDRAAAPQAWATAQSNLGVALTALGRRDADPARLLAAIAAFEAALEVRSRRDAPLDWAATKTNLGVALTALGEREEGTARLQAAVEAHRDALRELSRARSPNDWAAAQANLGAALLALGDRGQNGRYAEAAGALEAALEEQARERNPRAWAATQHNLGLALAGWGERTNDAGRLEAAAAAFRAALEERTRGRDAIEWAASQAGLGRALRLAAEATKDASLAEQAIAAYRAALAAELRQAAPLDWAIAQNGLGNAEEALGDLRDGDERALRYATAIAAFEAAGAGFAEAGAPASVKVAEANRVRVTRKAQRGDRGGGPLAGLFGGGD